MGFDYGQGNKCIRQLVERVALASRSLLIGKLHLRAVTGQQVWPNESSVSPSDWKYAADFLLQIGVARQIG